MWTSVQQLAVFLLALFLCGLAVGCSTQSDEALQSFAIGGTACDENGDAGGYALTTTQCVIEASSGVDCAAACDGEDVAGTWDFTCDSAGTNAANGPNPGCGVEPPRSYKCVCNYTASGDSGNPMMDAGGTDAGTSPDVPPGPTECVNDDQSHLADVDAPANPSNYVIAGSGKVAYVGCSQTRESTKGYQDLGGSRTATGSFGGCSIDEWNDPTSGCRNTLQRWITSPAGLNAGSASEVTDAMFQICIRSVREGTYDYDDIVDTAEYLESVFPNVERVYVYGLEYFEENNDPGYNSTCHGATLTQQDLTRQWSDDLATRNSGSGNQDGLTAAYLSVNNLGYLSTSTTFSTPPNDDFCHPGHLDSEQCGTGQSCNEGNGRLIMGETLCALLGDCNSALCEAAPGSAP